MSPHAAARLHRIRGDAALVRRFRAGDESAFAVLHDRYAAGIRSYAAYMLRGTVHDPDDAAQDVFLRAYQAMRRDERDIDVRPWLFRIAHNRCLDALRRPATDDLDDDAPLADRRGDPAAAIEQREALRALLRDIGALTDAQRSALLLRELGGLSHDAVAEALGITETSSRMLVRRARLALTEAMEARELPCLEVRERLVAAADAGSRASRHDRRHVAQCGDCRTWQRAQARMERELSLLVPGGGAGLIGLWRVLGGGSAAAGAGGAVATTGGATGGALLAGAGAKLAVGTCCALLGVGTAIGLDAATEHHGARPPRTSASAAKPHRTHATADPRPVPHVIAAPQQRHPTTATPKPQAKARPATLHEASTAPARQTTVDLAKIDEPQPTATKTTPPAHQTTVDLADLGGP